MRNLIVAAAIALQCLTSGVRAQDMGSPEALAAAQELAGIMSQDTITQLSQAMTAQIWPKLQTEFGPKVDPATLADLRTEFQNALSRFVTDALKDAPTIYARYFTAQELRDLAGFYQTPTGQKALRTMPRVMADSFGTMMPRMQGFQGELQAAMAAVLKRHGYQQ
jgi:hypothetical protein